MVAGVSVDRDFARFGNKSYAINKINSIEVRSHEPNSSQGAIIMSIIAGGLLLGIPMNIPQSPANAIMCFVGALIFAGIAYYLWKQSAIVEYQLFLMTSSSEAQAFTSRDLDEVVNLRNEIETQMARRH